MTPSEWLTQKDIKLSDMSVSESTTPAVDTSGSVAGLGAPFPVGYKAFQPEDHGLDRGFRLTAFSDMKGWGCKVPQETLLKLLQGLEPDRPAPVIGEDGGTGTGGGDEASEYGQLAPVPHGPRLGEFANNNICCVTLLAFSVISSFFIQQACSCCLIWQVMHSSVI